MELNKIYNEDCLEGMKLIDENSIDLIVIDPPYNIGKAEWDKIDNYIEWMGKVFLECQRTLKDNGSFYFWHNDFEQMAELQRWVKQNTEFKFKSFNIWDKGDFRALSWKNPTDDNNLRSWFQTTEYCLFYTLQDDAGINTTKIKNNNFTVLRNYFKKLQEYIGLSLSDINKALVHRKAEHCFYWKSTQWDLPTEQTYQELIKEFDIDKYNNFKNYIWLDLKYKKLRYTHNLDKNHNNVWKSNYRNNGERHPTEKPIDIIKRIIKTSSNEGGTILDCFMGSGTTAVACLLTNRNFIGFELEEKYYNIALKRIGKLDKSYYDELPEEEKPKQGQLF